MNKYKSKKHIPLNSNFYGFDTSKKVRRTYYHLGDSWQEEELSKSLREKNISLLKYSLEGNRKLVRMMLELDEPNANLNYKDKFGNNALMFAVKSSKVEVVKYLLKRGIIKDYENEDGTTPLGLAVQKNQINTVKAFISNGADINFANKNKDTALMIAIRENNILLVKLLISCGADINAANKEGVTCVMMSCQRRDRKEIFDFLVSSGADLTLRDEEGKDAFMHAINNNARGNMDVILKRYPKCVKNVDIKGMTPLMLCAKRGNREALRVLISNGVNVYARDEKRRDALAYANMGYRENKECIQILEKAVKIYDNVFVVEERDALLAKFAKNNRVENSCIR